MLLIKKILVAGGLSFFILFSNAATALNTSEATELISSLVKDINIIINSKKPATYMYLDFKNVLTKYGDTKIMSQKILANLLKIWIYQNLSYKFFIIF